MRLGVGLFQRLIQQFPIADLIGHLLIAVLGGDLPPREPDTGSMFPARLLGRHPFVQCALWPLPTALCPLIQKDLQLCTASGIARSIDPSYVIDRYYIGCSLAKYC